MLSCKLEVPSMRVIAPNDGLPNGTLRREASEDTGEEFTNETEWPNLKGFIRLSM